MSLNRLSRPKRWAASPCTDHPAPTRHISPVAASTEKPQLPGGLLKTPSARSTDSCLLRGRIGLPKGIEEAHLLGPVATGARQRRVACQPLLSIYFEHLIK